MAKNFLERLEQGALVADGGFGTTLYERGVFISHCFDELNLIQPELVREIHTAWLRAGAELIETNTFGANRVKLSSHGCADKLHNIGLAGARLAVEAAEASGGALVAGSVGPLGIKIEPWGPTSVDEAREMFRELAVALAEGGVDLFVLETFADINEIRQALLAVREAAPDLPVVAQMTLGDDGNSLYGTTPEVFTKRLEEWGADVIGVNCSVGPAVMLETIERMAAVTEKRLSAVPNAGVPRSVDGRNIYLCSPDYLASYARRFLQAGASLVGGCCGTTPEHIKAIALEVRGVGPGYQRTRSVVMAEDRPAVEAIPTKKKSTLAGKVAEGKFVWTVEVVPPRGIQTEKVISGIKLLAEAGVDAINIPDSPRASARMSCTSMALTIKREVGIETIIHYCCRDRNLLGMQGDILGLYSLDLKNILCTTGDPPKIGNYPDATAVFDVDSIGLTNMVHRLNEGYDIGGNPIGPPTGWHIGVTASPAAISLDAEVRRFEWKVDAGAEFAITAPIFDVGQLETFVKRTEHCRIPLLAGIWPLTSLENAEFMNNEILAGRLPETILERMRRASERSKEHALAEGVLIAQEMLAAVAPMVQGALLATPSRGHQRALEVKAALGSN